MNRHERRKAEATDEKPRRNIWLAVPCYTSQISWLTQKCLIHDMMPLIGRGDVVRIFDEIGHADIYLARAQICARFLEDKDATDLVMIDSDMAWEAYGLCRLLDHQDVDIVAAAYPKRSYPVRFAVRSEVNGQFHGDLNSGLMEVWGMPAGFMRIKRHVLEKMWAHYEPTLGAADGMEESTANLVRLFDPYWYEIDGKRHVLAEDYAFCQRWRDLGGKVHMDATLEMGHIGMHTFKGRFADSLVPNEDKKEEAA